MIRSSTPRVLACLLAISGLAVGCGDDDASNATVVTHPGSDTSTAVADDATVSATVATSGVIPAGEGARGVTDDTITVGMVRLAALEGEDDAANVGASYDVPDGADQEDAISAVVDHINATGGIGGRTVEVVFYYYDINSFFTPQGRIRENQAACATFTEDNEVFVFSGDNITEEEMIDCARVSGIPMIAAGSSQAYPAEATIAGMTDLWYAPSGFTADRRERTVGSVLAASGFFGDGAKVAILTLDRPGVEAGVDAGLLPALKEAGIEPEVTIAFPDILESPWPNYILQLQDAGITHVVMSGSNGGALPLISLMQAADEQQYHPKWGLGSDNAPSDLVSSDVPAAQLENVTGVGWMPFKDVASTDAESSTGEQCDEIMSAVGQPTGPFNYAPCDFFFFLRAAVDASDELSPSGLARGVAALADSYPSAFSLGGRALFSADRHDGAGVEVRLVTYDQACGCMTYSSEPITVDGES